ncbi:hypothetical protein EDD85DRAFT_774842, partial [Armillaria nabsnona]
SAETKNSTGMRATSVVICICACHEMVPSLGLELILSDRYCNVDYVLLSEIEPVQVKSIFCSYDIVCQWLVNLQDYMQEMPEYLQIPNGVEVMFSVPKLHCPVHIKKCQVCYVITIQPQVARTNGEGIEHVWAFVSRCAVSTKKMGPGLRHNTLDCQFHYMNWCKYIRIGMST